MELQDYDYVDKGERLKRNAVVVASLIIITNPLLSIAASILAGLAATADKALSERQFEDVIKFFNAPKFGIEMSRIPTEEKVAELIKSSEEIIKSIESRDMDKEDQL